MKGIGVTRVVQYYNHLALYKNNIIQNTKYILKHAIL